MPTPEYKTTQPKNRKHWRQWHEKNHSTSPGIWMIYHKKVSGKTGINYNLAMEDALCFGCIDSAKLSIMREARIKQTVLMAAVNKKPGLKGFKL
jgi:uncharacterized protein YdeI (YjbR/CyaY-like superfamily)